jgi:hypothetical protein
MMSTVPRAAGQHRPARQLPTSTRRTCKQLMAGARGQRDTGRCQSRLLCTSEAPPHQKRPKRGATNAIEFKRKGSRINEPDRYTAAHNGLVAGSSPAGPTSLRLFREPQLDKAVVVAPRSSRSLSYQIRDLLTLETMVRRIGGQTISGLLLDPNYLRRRPEESCEARRRERCLAPLHQVIRDARRRSSRH